MLPARLVATVLCVLFSARHAEASPFLHGRTNVGSAGAGDVEGMEDQPFTAKPPGTDVRLFPRKESTYAPATCGFVSGVRGERFPCFFLSQAHTSRHLYD